MRRLLVAVLVLLAATAGAASAQMVGEEMMSPGMMGPGMMGAMMPSMMEGMMPGKMRGCMMLAEGMMKGHLDLDRMRDDLDLSDEQAEKLRAALRPFQKEAILTFASMKVGELELSDILGAAKVDFGKVEAKLKEIEAMRTKARLVHYKAADAVKGILTKDQLQKLQGMDEDNPPPAAVSPQEGAAPGGEAGHEQHH